MDKCIVHVIIHLYITCLRKPPIVIIFVSTECFNILNTCDCITDDKYTKNKIINNYFGLKLILLNFTVYIAYINLYV